MKRTMMTVLAVALLVAVAGAWTEVTDLRFLDGEKTTALAATAACTTKWQTCKTWRTQALYWQQWTAATSTDSAQVKWEYQLAFKDTTEQVTAWSVVEDSAISFAGSGTVSTFYVRYYPAPSLLIRFCATGLTNNSDSTNVKNPRVVYDDGVWEH